MNRRGFILAAGGLAVVAGLPQVSGAQVPKSIAGAIAPGHPLQGSWAAWKKLCLTADGRIVDGFQNADSHSEGQGYGLALAAAFDDLAAFELIRAWTEANLAVRDDALFAWRWKHDQAVKVPDKNNASDGDLFFAWALSAMAVRHNKPEYGARARAIASDLLRLCAVPHPDGSGADLLLPGVVGFTTETGIVINPSYYMPRAMRDLAATTGVDGLQKLAEDGLALMDALAATGLVPDWVEVQATGLAKPPERFSPNAGYEAMRVPLFATWSENAGSAAALRYAAAVAATASAGADATTVFDAVSGASLERSPHPGYQAIAALVSCAQSGSVGASIPAFSTDQPYYPATLHLMALVAQSEMYHQCVPI